VLQTGTILLALLVGAPAGCGLVDRLKPECSPRSIGILESPDKFMPIGMASQIGRTDRGLAVWGLRVHTADAPGRWVIVDRRFVAVERAPA
jgi:hypothetical protein